MIVLDTDVVSELMKPSPHAAVRDWVLARVVGELFTTSITLAEILYGIERLPEGQRKELLRSTAAELFDAFSHHVLAFDAPAATRYANIVSSREKRGLPINGVDAQIASICHTHQATLVTRNVKDFQHTAVDVIDPWHST